MAEATSTALGEIKMTGKLAGTGTNPQLATIAGLTAGQYGPVINLNVTSDGLVSSISTSPLSSLTSSLPSASATQRGVVSLGANIFTNGSNTAGYQDANFGGSLVGTNASGLSTISCASYSVVIIVDGVTKNLTLVAANCGTINSFITELNSHLTGAVATLSGGNIRITSSTVGSLSSISITSGFNCLTGFINYSAAVQGTDVCQIYVPNASAVTAGVVKVGSGITLTGNTISVIPGSITPATTTILGGVIVPTSGNLIVDGSGNLSVPKATASVLGVVKVPTANGLSVDSNGVLQFSPQAITPATTTILGGVIVPTSGNLSVDGSGNLSVPPATNTTLGVVKPANTANLTISAGGLIDWGSSIVNLSGNNTFTKSFSTTPTVLSGTSVTPDLSTSNMFTLTLTGNTTINNPINGVNASTFIFVITQDATGGRTLTLGSNFKPGTGGGTISTIANSKSILSCVFISPNLYYNIIGGY